MKSFKAKLALPSLSNIGKTKIKFQFQITIHHLMKVQKNGKLIYITWERGRKWQKYFSKLKYTNLSVQ
mgnify:CR=1 FL=1